MLHRSASIVALLLVASPAAAAPRDELLRLAPPDAALVVVVQNARDHVRGLRASPFAAWFPGTAVGQKLLGSGEVKQLLQFAGEVLPALDTTPQALLDDVLGDAFAFAYTPAPPGKPDGERSVILVRPRKPETLAKIVAKLNEIQTKNGEVKAVARRTHSGAEYFERQKPNGGGEFYGFRGGVFAYSSAEAEVRAFLDRDALAVKDKVPELVSRVQALGIADAAAFILVNPRPLDAELQARFDAAPPGERRFLERLGGVWTGLEFAAVYATLDRDLELGLAVRFHADKLPADLKPLLVGPRAWGNPAALIPNDAMFGFAGHARAADLIDLVASFAPVPAGKPGVKEWVTQTLGPVVGRDNLPLVLNALGPNWAGWAEPPATGAFLPTLVAAVEVGGEGADRAKAEKALLLAVTSGFHAARVAYNGRHEDQIELTEEKDAATGLAITSLANEKGFPPGFRPSFSLTRGYLLLATSPDAIKRFRPPAPGAPPKPGHATLARLSGVATRGYIKTHGEKLTKFLADLGVGDEKALRQHVAGLADVLDLVDSAELTARDIESGIKLSVRIKTARPLKE